MPIDQGQFRAVVGHFASGVVVVTAMADDQPVGLTCQSFFSLSLDPPMIAIAPGVNSTSWPKVAQSGRFCANVLESGQEALAWAFSQSGADKFAGVGWSPAANGAPRIRGSLAWIDCRIENVHEEGDHFLVTATVEDLESVAGQPLLFYRGGFGGFVA